MLIDHILLVKYRACKDQVALFDLLWPNGLAVPTDTNNAAKIATTSAHARLHIEWAICLLPKDKRETVKVEVASLRAEYEAKVAPIWEEYYAITAPIWVAVSPAEYVAKSRPLWEESRSLAAPIWEECNTKIALLILSAF